MTTQAGVAVRVIATRVVDAVMHRGRSLKAELAANLPRVEDARDRALLEAICFAVLRSRARSDAALAAWMPKPLGRSENELRALLHVGFVQVVVMGLPAHAALSATVEAVRALGRPHQDKLVNALLRRAQREGLPAAPSDALWPAWLRQQVRQAWPAQADDIFAASQQEAPLWLRVNRLRGNRDAYRQRLLDAGIEAEVPDGVPDALLLRAPVAATGLPGFAQGDVSVQDGAAQRVADLLDGLPADRPLLLVANEFLDALPVRQFVRRAGRWHERLVGVDDEGSFRFIVARHATPFPEAVAGITADASEDTVLELGPARLAMAQTIARRIVEQGGLALLIDYGSVPGAPMADTFRAVRRHAAVDPLRTPGEADLSAHVDFHAVADAALAAGVRVYGPVSQGDYLGRLGAGQRLERLLASATGAQRASLESGYRRLVAPEAMGDLFKVLVLAAPGDPIPAGLTEDDRRR